MSDLAQNQVTIVGQDAFHYLKVDLPPGGEIFAEAGAMSAMDLGVDLSTRLNGGLIGALLIKFLGKESLFMSRFFNPSAKPTTLYLTQETPGQIVTTTIQNEVIFLQPGAFIACTPGVSIGVRWAGISSWLGGEGLFRLKLSGVGQVWYGAYGSIVERDVKGSYVVDSGHLLSYPNHMKLSIRLAGGIFSSFFGGEGLVLVLHGEGKIKLQTRSIQGLASWLNPFFR